MRSFRRQSQVVNNFFTFVTIIMISIVLVLYVEYGPKEKRVNSKLDCQKLSKTNDVIVNQELLNKAYLLLNNGYYKLNGGFIKPIFGKFFLKNKISIKEANQEFIKSINVEKNDSEIFLNIQYEIIENDKNNPRKQSTSNQIFAGSLVTSFRVKGKESFRVNTDFMTYDKKEIALKIACTIKAFKHNGKK